MATENTTTTEHEVEDTQPNFFGKLSKEALIKVISNTEAERLKELSTLIDRELRNRDLKILDELEEKIKSLPPELQEMLRSRSNLFALPRGETAVIPEQKEKVEKKEREKNPLRMYQDYPADNPQYKIAPLVNVEANEVFTGGNPKNKAWLADLSSVEERYEKYGTLKKLENDPDFLEVYKKIPKAVFELVDDRWVDCSQA